MYEEGFEVYFIFEPKTPPPKAISDPRASVNVNGVMVLNLCISPDDALYLYQVSKKYLTGFQSY